MQTFSKITFALVFVLFTFTSNAQIKVACVGNSITYGSGIKDRDTKSYPAQMQRILGSSWKVENFGIGGATLLKKGDKPYWGLERFADAKNFQPDVVIIKLGTNDSKPQNWKHKDEYISDYKELIETFRNLESKPMIFVCLPVPAYAIKWGINPDVIKNETLPMIKKVAKQSKSELINLYKPLRNKVELFPDRIHPNAAGARAMATVIAKELIQSKKKIMDRK